MIASSDLLAALRPARSTRPCRPLAGRIRAPGDKSISHRALMFAALSVGETRITGLLEGEDVLRTAAAMRALGANIRRDGTDWLVSGRGIGGLVEPPDVLDMGNSGTAARLLAGILASHPIFSVMTGDASLRRRPMKRVTDPLSLIGARFDTREGGRLPLAICGTGSAMPLQYRLPVASAQVKSACLLAGLNAQGITRIEEPHPTRDHSENMLRHFGASVDVAVDGAGRVVTLQGQPELVAADIITPGDPSSAAFPIVAALIVPGSELIIEGVGLNPLRTGLIDTLIEMGGNIIIGNRRVQGGEPIGDITVRHSALHGITVPAERAPSMIDEYPILAMAAACASGETVMLGLHELRVKESDRLSATCAILRNNGVIFEEQPDTMRVTGNGEPPDGGGMVATEMDHRLAMSALVLGMATRNPVDVDDTVFIDTSFPGFIDLMNGLGGAISA